MVTHSSARQGERESVCKRDNREKVQKWKRESMRGKKLKVIRKFFLKHNKSFRWHLGDYEKHHLFPFEGL